MKITGSAVNLSAQHEARETTKQSQRLLFWTGQRPAGVNNGLQLAMGNRPAASVALSEQAKEQLRQLRQEKSAQAVLAVDPPKSDLLTDKDKLKIALVEKLIEMITGKKVKISVLELPDEAKSNAAAQQAASQAVATQTQGAQPQRAGWGLEYDAHYFHAESEALSFQAQGVVQTADGRQIDFSVSLNMSRRFVEETNISVRAGDAVFKDPLVINFDAPAAALTETKFQFDLDADGAADEVSFVGPGSGFIALDQNGNGAIDNGSELFGAQSGDGFADLTAYDSDGNGWIDESDPVFDKLRIWSKDAAGNDQLFALGAKGVGAIYLGRVDTEFALKDQANETQGQIRATGVFLRENGTAGTMQQVDLAV